MFGISIISGIVSLYLLTIFTLSPYIMKKTFIRVVFFATIADLISSISTSFGEVDDGTPLCLVQGILSNIFPLASIIWHLFAAYLLYFNVVILKPVLITYFTHLICWGFPIFITALIYTSNRIGEPRGKGWCFVANRSESPSWSLLFWNIMSFYLWIGLTGITIMIFTLLIHKQLHTAKKARSKLNMNHVGNATQVTVTSIYIYPLVLLFCWCIPCVVDTYGMMMSHTYPHESIIYFLSNTLPLLQGLITTIIFISSTKYIRRLVYQSFGFIYFIIPCFISCFSYVKTLIQFPLPTLREVSSCQNIAKIVDTNYQSTISSNSRVKPPDNAINSLNNVDNNPVIISQNMHSSNRLVTIAKAMSTSQRFSLQSENLNNSDLSHVSCTDKCSINNIDSEKNNINNYNENKKSKERSDELELEVEEEEEKHPDVVI